MEKVKTDMLEYNIGKILSMKYKKRNYETHNKEILVIIKYLERWRYLLEEAQNQFKIWSNHKNLEYFMSSQKLH